MDKNFIPGDWEKKLYDKWEKSGVFEPEINSKKEPFCIVLPLPNANADLHVGHGRYVYEDIMIRYAHLSGKDSFWLAGADHAGFETQVVYEKHLAKAGKSRFDFDRETLYQDIWNFVAENRTKMELQLRAFGFALAWEKTIFTLDQGIVEIVYTTFAKLFKNGLIYRRNRLVNYCTKNGTAFSDLEVVSQEAEGKLYYIRYPLENGGEIIIATTRPETMWGDEAVMVHPSDSRYLEMIGQKVLLPLSNRPIPIIADEAVEPKFGTGAVKVTPAHDQTDFEVGERHGLPSRSVIGFNGKMMGTNMIDGLKVSAARVETLRLLQEGGFLIKTIPHKLIQKTCYKCGGVIEPLLKEQWYLSVEQLKLPAIKAIESGEVKIFPKRFTKLILRWYKDLKDWNISRQVVWGIRIPAWQCQNRGKSNLDKNAKESDNWFFSKDKPSKCLICGDCQPIQDEDTFDTWFSSGQWPFATLQLLDKQFPGIYRRYYPTAVMETAYEILYFWVSRMLMLGIYMTDSVPFRQVYLHGLVRDAKGQKMSKSKGNVINPMPLIEKYGADALRAALVIGTKEGSDTALSEEKVRAMRNFANKIWNMGRFILINQTNTFSENLSKYPQKELEELDPNTTLAQLVKEFALFEKSHWKRIEKLSFNTALDELYEFTWHRFADHYIEQLKSSILSGDVKILGELKTIYLTLLKLLHPYMPFVTEAIYNEFGLDLYS